MELPCRDSRDRLLVAGEMTRIRARLRALARKHAVSSVIACAFDHRTRMLPFLYADMRMAPGGVRAIGSAMVDAGFPKTRIVLQQWNRNFRPSEMRLDGRIPDLFMVSCMRIHVDPCRDLLRDACRIDPQKRPLIIAGGPKAVYEPWDLFSADPLDQWGADVAVTGEEYVLLDLLEVLLSTRARGESMRSAFMRARDSGALDDVPGLVYPRTGRGGAVEELVDTGIQRLLGDLDELPDPVLGYQLLEPPGRRSTLAARALGAGEVRKHSRIASLLITTGCKFKCPYCPIPAYNQRRYRTKSGERIADEIERIHGRYGIRIFFGADDNFFNDKKRTLDIAQALARRVDAGSRAHSKIRWGTEATVHDTLRMKEHLGVVRKAGLFALWLGVEDITATLIKKGQQADKTLEAFRLLRAAGIYPIPMLMHHESQPLYTWRGNYGLLNQLRLLRKAGALYMQVLMLTPAVGSKSYDEAFTTGLAYQSVGGSTIEPRVADGNHVVASRDPRPWRKQLNILAAYAYFFNPLRLLWALVCPKSRIPLADADLGPVQDQDGLRPKRLRRRLRRKLAAHLADAAVQLVGMWGLTRTAPSMLGWSLRLMRGKIKRSTAPPGNQIPMRSAGGGPAAHALPGTPLSTRQNERPRRKAWPGLVTPDAAQTAGTTCGRPADRTPDAPDKAA
jgi:radical SAM superfamily enzyme YgiQ (UPF0313 family)